MQMKLSTWIYKTFNNKFVLWSIILFELLAYAPIAANDDKVVKIDVSIIKVVYETEEGYVLTDKGSFMLPNPSTEIEMDPIKFDLLINNLKRLIGKRSTLYAYDNAVVGISSKSDGINYVPEYKKRKKKVYTSPPIEIETTMQRWDIDSYRLSLVTRDGIFCIFNTFAAIDYYNRVQRKLKVCCQSGADANVKILIKYHKNEGSYECPGEIEDIELLKTK